MNMVCERRAANGPGDMTCVPKEMVCRLLTEKLVLDKHREKLAQQDFFRTYGPTLVSDQFFIVVLNTLDYVPTGEDEQSMDCLDEEEIQNRFVAGLPGTYRAYPFVNGGDLYILVNLTKPVDMQDQTQRERVSNEFLESCELCRRMLFRQGVRLQIFITPLFEGLGSMDLRLEDLRKMIYSDMSLAHLPCKYDDIITETDLYEVMEQTCRQDVEMLAGLEQHFYKAVMLRNFDDAYETVCSIIDIESHSFAAAISLKHRLCNKVETLYSLLGVPYYESEPRIFSVHFMLKGIEDAITVDDMRTQMSAVLNDFKNYFTTVLIAPEERMNRIAEYINQNYMDPSLCADKICEIFNISISYLSRTFKNYIGTKLLDYIHTTKLAAAKELLRTTNDTIEKIAAQVGYQNTLTFNRAFKRYENTTPGLYRSVELKKQKEAPL